MKHIFTKLKMSVTALTLCFVTLVSLALMPFCRRIVVFADGSINNIDYVESLYTNGGMTDEELAEGELEINETYGQFLAFNEEDELTFSENIQSMDGLDPEIVEMIQNNVDAMNFLVEEGVGYINSDAEFVFTETDEYFQQFRSWGFNLRWNRMWASYDKDYATIFAIFFLAVSLKGIVGDFIKKPQQIDGSQIAAYVNDKSTLETLIYEARRTAMASGLRSEIANFVKDQRLATLYLLVGEATSLVAGSTLFGKILKVALAFISPSISDCLLILYNAGRFQKGVSVTVCWIPTRRDRLGVTFKTLR